VIARPIPLIGNAFQLRFAFHNESSASFHRCASSPRYKTARTSKSQPRYFYSLN
jgi:hypothetical protein